MALAMLGLFWVNGTFDKALEPWGLNAEDCSENTFGAVVCGEELEQQRGPVKSGAEWAEEEAQRRARRRAAQVRLWEREASRDITRESGEARRESEAVARATFAHWDEREPRRRAARETRARSREKLREEARELFPGYD